MTGMMQSNKVDCFPCVRLPARIRLPESDTTTGGQISILAKIIRQYYAPFILRPFVKGVIALFFGGVFIASVISMQHIQLGLGQCLSHGICFHFLKYMYRPTARVAI
jgi:Niemann-Pick C1 protein